jgi:hypothetical protein
MKHVLFVLLGLFLLPSAQGQANRHASMDRMQAMINPKILQLLPDAFVPSRSDQVPATRGASPDLLLDSTLTFLFQSGSAQDSSFHLRTMVEYPQPGQKLERVSYFNGLEWHPLQFTTFYADAQGRLLEALAMVYDPSLGVYVPDSRLLSWPHAESPDLLDSFFLLQWNSDLQGWEVMLEHHFMYDAQDRLIEEWSTFQLFEEIIIFRELHSYDAKGDLTQTMQFAEMSGFEFMTGLTEITYVNHLPTQRIGKVFNGLEFQNDSRVLYAYDNQGWLMVQRDYLWETDSGGWFLTNEARYDYDQQGRVSALETYEAFDGFAIEERVAYQYVEAEHLAMEAHYQKPDPLGDWVLDTRTWYFYQGTSALPGKPVQALPLSIWPNPAMQQVTVRLEEYSELTLYDALGRRVRSLLGAGEVVLDLGGLPAGIYQVNARSGQQWYQERLVKL